MFDWFLIHFFVSGESWLPAIDDAGSSLGIIIFTPDDDQDGTCHKEIHGKIGLDF